MVRARATVYPLGEFPIPSCLRALLLWLISLKSAVVRVRSTARVLSLFLPG
jgi:hypothetical protein